MITQQEVRIAVVGVGSMGANHARVYDTLKWAKLIAVVDSQFSRAQEIAETFGCEAFGSLDELHGRVDAASVVVPSSAHFDVTLALFEMGIHCLVEKPLALRETEVRGLFDVATKKRLHLLAGHIERFNPAVAQLKSVLGDDHNVVALDARRLSSVSARIADVDVIADLMIHDIDIAVDLINEPVTDVVARGVRRGGAPDAGDHVTAIVTFRNGATASFTASRITQNKIRSLDVTTDQAFFNVDYTAQGLLIHRQGRIGPVDTGALDVSRYVLDLQTERVFVRRIEPLVAELEHFVDVVAGRATPLVTAGQTIAVTQLLEAIRGQAAMAP